MILAIPVGHRGHGHSSAEILRPPREHAALDDAAAARVLAPSSSAREWRGSFSTPGKDKDPIDIPLFANKFYIDEIYAGPDPLHAGFSRAVKRLVRSMDSRTALVRHWRGRRMGTRIRAPHSSRSATSGLCLPLRPRSRSRSSTSLFSNKMSILTLLIAVPIIAAIAVLLGAPARKTAFCAALLNLALLWLRWPLSSPAGIAFN